jgi:protein-disulfide isomerase
MLRKIALLAVCLAGFAAPAMAQDLKQMLADKTLGDPNAPVTIIEYASFTCPHCAAFHRDDLPEVKKQLIDTGRAKFVFRDFPLDRRALAAGMMARCIDPTGGQRYFGTIDLLFKAQSKWAVPDEDAFVNEMLKIGRLAGLKGDSLKACLENAELQDGILYDQKEAVERYKVNSTPSFVIIGKDEDDFVTIGGGQDAVEKIVDAVEDKSS